MVYGINHEHGDINAGSMYPLVFIVPGMMMAFSSYILYFLFDRLTQGQGANFLKNFIYFPLVLGMYLFDIPSIVFILTLATTILINLIMSASNRLVK